MIKKPANRVSRQPDSSVNWNNFDNLAGTFTPVNSNCLIIHQFGRSEKENSSHLLSVRCLQTSRVKESEQPGNDWTHRESYNGKFHNGTLHHEPTLKFPKNTSSHTYSTKKEHFRGKISRFLFGTRVLSKMFPRLSFFLRIERWFRVTRKFRREICCCFELL